MMQQSGVVPPQMAPMAIDPQQQQQYQQAPPPMSQQQWMIMQAQAQAQAQAQQHQSQAAMQPPQLWPQQPPQAAAPPLQYSASPASASDEIRSLWIGDLQPWMDEAYINTCFYPTGELVSVKVIRNKQTGQPEGYGFLEFRSRASAEQILQTYNGTPMPNGEQNYRLNWATLGAGERRTDDSPDYTIFVGDLAADVTDYLLQETFKPHYSSVKGAKVVTDRTTGRSKGYGFVRFGDETEQMRAMSEMNGALCSTRPMRIGPAATKKPIGGGQQYEKVGWSPLASYQSSQGNQGESDPNNTTIFVGGLDPNVSDNELRAVFGRYGELTHVKIPVGKCCGFVQFSNRACAEQALSMLNNTLLGGQNIRLSWGRSPSSKQAQPEQSQYGAYYGYAQGYDAYGYAPPPQDPNMYYGGYPAYGNYPQPQQQ